MRNLRNAKTDFAARAHKPSRRAVAVVLTGLAAAALTGCVSQTQQHGYVASQTALQQVPVGSSREQVLIVLGSPSTTTTLGTEIFYYISQTRKRGAAFMNSKVVDQRVLAVYFDKDSRVERIADYGMKDGRIFDFISRTTPTSGKDISFIGQLLAGAGRIGGIGG